MFFYKNNLNTSKLVYIYARYHHCITTRSILKFCFRVSPGRKVEWGQLVPLEALVRGAATERRVLLVNPVYQ